MNSLREKQLQPTRYALFWKKDRNRIMGTSIKCDKMKFENVCKKFEKRSIAIEADLNAVFKKIILFAWPPLFTGNEAHLS